MIPMIIGYTNWELYYRYDKLRNKLHSLEPGTPEYRAVDGELNRVMMLESALDRWIKANKGCWFCWDSMQIVEEDRESFKGVPGYEEQFEDGFVDDDNHYSGIPKIMSQPAKIKKTILPLGEPCSELPFKDNHYAKYDIVSSSDESVVLLEGISKCPYCGRMLEDDWGRPYRNNEKFWGYDEYSTDYYWDDVDTAPWEDDDEL